MGAIMASFEKSISPATVSNLEAVTGSSVSGIRRGLTTAAATLLGALSGRLADHRFMSEALSLVQGQAASAAAAGYCATDPVITEPGSNLLRMVFGSNLDEIESRVALSAGIRFSGNSLFAVAAPPLLASLAAHVPAGSGVSQLANVLIAELPSIRNLIPSGLPGVNPPHFSGTASFSKSVTGDRMPTAKSSSGWLWPVLLLGGLVIGALLFYFQRHRSQAAAPVENAAAITTAALSNATKAAWAKLGALFARKLPNGAELSIPQFGVENKLINWIESSNPVSDEVWFNFDRLLFDPGSTTPQPASEEQLQNVAAVMKAYPRVKIMIGGYTDNKGDPAANLNLSTARANSVMAELTHLGVDPSRLEAQGYGEQHPIADNNTEGGRALNRRIALRVTEK